MDGIQTLVKNGNLDINNFSKYFKKPVYLLKKVRIMVSNELEN